MGNTLSANALLESNEATIVKKETRLLEIERELAETKESARIRTLNNMRTRARHAVENLIAQSEEIRKIASPAQQRMEYGEEKWNEQFVRLGDIEELEGFNETGEKLQLLLWSKLPNCRFKRFQELFCKPEDFCLPRFRVEGQTLIFENIAAIHLLSLAPVMVDIDRVPDALLEHVQLVTFDDEDKDRIVYLKKKAAAIPQFKEIFETAEQLTPYNERILIIRSADTLPATIENTARGAPAALEGGLLYIRSDERIKNGEEKNGRFPSRVAQYFPDAYSAERKTFHQEEVYVQEISQLARLIVRLKNMNGELNRNWKASTPQEEKNGMRSRANALFTECAETLELCGNRFKVAAKTHLTKIQSLIGEDIKKAPNVSAAMTCMVATRESLEKRHGDMRFKGRYNQDDRQGLAEGISLHEAELGEYAKGVKIVASRLENKPALFESTTLTEAQIHTNVAGILTPLHPDTIAGVRLAPFMTYAVRLREKYDLLESALSAQEKEKSQDVLIQMHLILKFLEVQKTFERIKKDIMDPRFVTVGRIRSFISEVSGVFSAFQICTDRIVESYIAPFKSMNEQLNRIEERLKIYEGRDLDLSQRTEMFKRLKEFLDTFDISKIVADLE